MFRNRKDREAGMWGGAERDAPVWLCYSLRGNTEGRRLHGKGQFF